MSTVQQPKIPKYWKLAEALRKQIASGELLPGAQLPSVAQMQTQYGISLSTVNQAVALLEKDGLVVREQGRGTFVAQRSAGQTAGTLGLVLHVESLASFYTMDLLAGIREEADRQELEILWLNDADLENCTKADAILLYCHATEALALQVSQHIPHALLFQHSPDFNCVTVDDFTGANLATQHLIDLGHRQIAYMLSSDSDSISLQRLAGYRAALQRANIAYEDQRVCFMRKNGTLTYRVSGELTMQNWLKNDWQALDCTAILAHNDETAIGIIKALTEQGLHVPDDVSVVGFDGTQLSELSTPELTTVKVPLRELGVDAVKRLSAQIQAPGLPELQKVVLPVQLKRGNSAAAIKESSEHIVASLSNQKE